MSVGWGRKGLSIVAAISIVGSMFVLPAIAHKDKDRGRHESRGHGIAVVESYEAATNQLVLATKSFGVVTLTVAENAMVGVVGGGKTFRGGGFHEGTEADLVAGAVVLHSKVEEGLMTKVLLFLPKVDDCDEDLVLRTDDHECDEPDDDECDEPESDDRRAKNGDHGCDQPDDDECDEDDDGEDPESNDRNGNDGEEDEDVVECPDTEESPTPDAPEDD